MQFEFSDEQLQIRDGVRRLLTDHDSIRATRTVMDGPESFDRALWHRLAELGLIGVAIPEDYGGAGAGQLEVCVIAEELGRGLAAVPFASTVLGADLLARHGTETQRQRYLPGIAAGETIVCIAFAEGRGNPHESRVGARMAGGLINGLKTPVLDGGIADVAILVAKNGDGVALTLLDLAEAGVKRSRLETIDPSRDQASLSFRDVPAEPLTGGWADFLAAMERAAIIGAFEQLGGAEAALEMARGYALERHAFGRPIGSFQAIKHKLADMYVATALARSNCYYGAWALATGTPDLAEAAALARISATEAFQFCAKENIQIHGGFGFTWELDCHLYYRRSNLLALTLGGLSHWQEKLITRLAAAPGVLETAVGF